MAIVGSAVEFIADLELAGSAYAGSTARAAPALALVSIDSVLVTVADICSKCMSGLGLTRFREHWVGSNALLHELTLEVNWTETRACAARELLGACE
jgi:hypothetical protein